MIEKQVILDEKGRFKALRPGRELTSQTLNNPAEPESTIRKKAGKVHQGWVGHFAETVDLDTGRKVIDSSEFEQNICSDVEFCSREIEKMTGRKETGVLVADGACISDELIEKAADHDIELMGTDLTSKDTPDMMADFVIREGEDGETEVICPNGKKADRVSISGEGSCSVSYLRKSYHNCLHQADCPLKKGRRVRSGKVSAQQIRRANLQRVMKTEEYKEYCHFRNGVEAIPSQLRRNQDIDKIPARGALRKKNRFTIDLMAINTRRALRYALEDQGKPQNWGYSNFWSALICELYKVFHNTVWKWELLAVPS